MSMAQKPTEGEVAAVVQHFNGVREQALSGEWAYDPERGDGDLAHADADMDDPGRAYPFLRDRAERALVEHERKREAARRAEEERELAEAQTARVRLIKDEFGIFIRPSDTRRREDGRIVTVVDGLAFDVSREYDPGYGYVPPQLRLLSRCPECGEEIPIALTSGLISLGERLRNPPKHRPSCHDEGGPDALLAGARETRVGLELADELWGEALEGAG